MEEPKTAANCNEWITPSAAEVISYVTPSEKTMLLACALGSLLTVVLFLVQMAELSVTKLRSRTITRTGYVLAVFPVTALCSFVVLLVPRAQPMIDIMIYTYYARWLFGFVELIAVDVYGDRTRMKSELRMVPTRMDMWPFTCFCGAWLPDQVTTGRLLHRMEWLIWQNGVVRCIVSLVAGGVTSNRIGQTIDLIAVNMLSVGAISVSCCTAMWGINVYANVVSQPLSMYRVGAQFRIAQCLVLGFNVQSNLFRLLGSHLPVIQCSAVFSRLDHAMNYYHIALIVEMAVFSMLVSLLFGAKNNALLRRSTHNYAVDMSVGGEADLTVDLEERVRQVSVTPPTKSIIDRMISPIVTVHQSDVRSPSTSVYGTPPTAIFVPDEEREPFATPGSITSMNGGHESDICGVMRDVTVTEEEYGEESSTISEDSGTPIVNRI